MIVCFIGLNIYFAPAPASILARSVSRAGISHLLGCAPTPFNDTLRVDALGYDDNFFVYNFRRHFYRWEEKRRQIRCSLRVLLATIYMTLKDDTIANIKCVVQTLDLPTPKCREKWVMV